MTGRPPIGVMPWWLWEEQYPTPTECELAGRVISLSEAIARYAAKRPYVPSLEWNAELGFRIVQLKRLTPQMVRADEPILLKLEE